MSRVKQAPGRRREGREGKRNRRRLLRSPCERPPAMPTGTGTFVRRPGGGRHNKWRLELKWPEVTVDTSGFPIGVKQYKVEVQYTANDVDWFDLDTYVIQGRRDEDDNARVRKLVEGIRANLAYRWRLTVVTRDCTTTSDWIEEGSPTDAPPAPSTVKIKRRPHGIFADWAEPEEPDDNDILDEDVDHYIALLYKSPDPWNAGTAVLVQTKRNVKKTQIRFNVEDDELTGAEEDWKYFVWVRSVSDERSKSALIPATVAGNSDPGATPSGKLPKNLRRVFTFTFPDGPADVITAGVYRIPIRVDADYKVRRVTGACDIAGTGGTTRIDVRVDAADMFADDPADQLTFASTDTEASTKAMTITTLDDGDFLRVRVAEVAPTPPEGMTINVICERMGS